MTMAQLTATKESGLDLVRDIAIARNDLPARELTAFTGQIVTMLEFKQETFEVSAVPLRAQDHPVLAAIWDNDEDDDVFAPDPAV